MAWLSQLCDVGRLRARLEGHDPYDRPCVDITLALPAGWATRASTATMVPVSWEELRVDLRELVARDPCPLQEYPDPRGGVQPLPATIRLKPWAGDAATALHQRFGEQVILIVGALGFPGRSDDVETIPDPSSDPVLDPADIDVIAPESLVVRAGGLLRIPLQVTNHRPTPISILTNGSAFGRVLDPATGEVVGGYVGAVTAVLRVYTVEPGATLSLPLIVGTASYKRALGYAVPPGEWLVEVVLRLREGDRRSRPLPLRIVE